MTTRRTADRDIPDPGFAGDAGEANPALVAALASGDPRAVHQALGHARLLVPVVAVLGAAEAGADGRLREKTTDMATVTLTGRDGRRALLAFTGLGALGRWRAEARPVPVAARMAALAVYAEGADALLLDVSGPVRYAVEGPALRALADGRELLAPHADPEVVAAVESALGDVDGVVGVSVLPPESGLPPGSVGEVDLRVVITFAPESSPDRREAAARAVAERLRADAILRARLGRGLEVLVET